MPPGPDCHYASPRGLPLPAGLSVAGVFTAFKGIALEGGKGGVDKKAAAIKKLLVACSGAEAKFIIRGLQVSSSSAAYRYCD